MVVLSKHKGPIQTSQSLSSMHDGGVRIRGGGGGGTITIPKRVPGTRLSHALQWRIVSLFTRTIPLTKMVTSSS